MRIFVLGAGYIGASLATTWTNADDIFWVSTTTPEKVAVLEKSVARAFLLQGHDKQRLVDILNECDVLVVSVAPGREKSYGETYLQTALSIREAVINRQKPLYLLYTSSTSVYGDHQGKVVDEASPLLNESEKGEILSSTEDVILSCENKHIKSCVLRLAGIYGPGRELERRAQSMSGRMMDGAGHLPTNHIHRDDILRAIEFCVSKGLQGVYNLANDEHRSRRVLYESLCLEQKIPAPQWDSSKHSEHGSNCIVSNAKITKAGFTFLFPTILS